MTFTPFQLEASFFCEESSPHCGIDPGSGKLVMVMLQELEKRCPDGGNYFVDPGL